MSQDAPASPRRVFISYAKADGEVARMIDASLGIAGVTTFLYERDIAVGDSIVERVYAELGASTDLAYLISSRSIGSRWVADELSYAKIRHRTEVGFQILPILLDESEPPAPVRYLRYADLRGWRNPALYRTGMLEILAVLGLSPVLVGKAQIAWWIQRRSRLEELKRLIYECQHLFDAAVGYWQYFDNIFGASRRENGRWAWKICTREIGLSNILKDLLEEIAGIGHEPRGEVISTAAATARDILAKGYYTLDDPWVGMRQVLNALAAITSTLSDLETEVITAMSAVVHPGPAE